jgi:hypothetical protein
MLLFGFLELLLAFRHVVPGLIHMDFYVVDDLSLVMD